MKRIKYAGGSFVTGDVVAKSLLAYAKKLTGNRPSISVDVPVLAADGSLSIHTLLIGPASQFDVEDADSEKFAAVSEEDEHVMFPKPELPAIGVVEPAESAEDAKKDAASFNEAVANIDNIL